MEIQQILRKYKALWRLTLELEPSDPLRSVLRKERVELVHTHPGELDWDGWFQQAWSEFHSEQEVSG